MRGRNFIMLLGGGTAARPSRMNAGAAGGGGRQRAAGGGYSQQHFRPVGEVLRLRDRLLTRRSMLLASMLGGALAPSNLEALADDLPPGPITFIVSFPAGGSIDVVMRAVAVKLQ